MQGVRVSELVAELSKLSPDTSSLSLGVSETLGKIQFLGQREWSRTADPVSRNMDGSPACSPLHPFVVLRPSLRGCGSKLKLLLAQLSPDKVNQEAIVLVNNDVDLYPIALPLVNCLQVERIGGLFYQTNLVPEIAEAHLLKTIGQMQLDWAGAQRWLSNSSLSFSPKVKIYYIDGQWYSRDTFPFPNVLHLIGFEKLFTCSALHPNLYRWSLSVPLSQAAKEIGACSKEASAEQRQKVESAADRLLEKYSPVVSSLVPDKNTAVNKQYPAPIGTCLSEFVSVLQRKLATYGNNVSTNIALRPIKFYDIAYLSPCSQAIEKSVDGIQDEWKAVVLFEYEGDNSDDSITRATFGEVIDMLSAPLAKRPWAMVCIGIERCSQDVRLVAKEVSKFECSFPRKLLPSIAALSINPFSQGGSLLETCNATKLDLETFVAQYGSCSSLQCYVVEGVYYSTERFEELLSMNTEDKDKLLPRKKGGHSSNIRVALPRLTMSELVANFGNKPSSVQQLLAKYGPTTTS